MSGVTDAVFRRIARRFGATLVVSEMVASEQFARGEEEARLRAEGAGIVPHVVQLAGRDPAWMAEAARLAEASGADIIDINMGCPAKRVTGGYAGSALMREPSLAARLLRATVAAVRVPVTVKMRLGWDEASRNAAELARCAEGEGAAAMTVHGRTRQQFYKGVADWRGVRPVAEAVPLPVVVNGDILCATTALQALAASGACAVMVGRASLGRPWLPGQIAAALRGECGAAPSAALRREAVVEHYEGLLGLYGRALGLRHARKHLAAAADEAGKAGFPMPTSDRLALVTAEDPEAVLRILARLYAEPLREAA